MDLQLPTAHFLSVTWFIIPAMAQQQIHNQPSQSMEDNANHI